MVPDDGSVEGGVAAPWDIQGGNAADKAEGEEAVGAAGGNGGREKYASALVYVLS